MNDRRRLTVDSVITAVSETLIGLPIYVLVPLLLWIDVQPFVWLSTIAAVCILGFWSQALLLERNRILVVMANGVLAIAAGIGLWGVGLGGFAAAVLYGVAAFRGALSVGSRPPDIRALWVSLLLYAAASIVYAHVEELQHHTGIIRAFGMLTLAWTLYTSNGSTLWAESLPGAARPQFTGAQLLLNRALTTAILAIILTASAIPQIGQGILAVIRVLLHWLLKSDTPPTNTVLPTPLPQPSAGQTPMPEQPSSWMLLLQKLMIYAGYVLAIALALLLLYFLARRFQGFIRQALRFLFTRRDEADRGYVDEQTSLRSWKEWLASLRALKLPLRIRFRQEPDWESLSSNREKVRYLYRVTVRRLMSKGGHVDPAWTPRETGAALAQAQSVKQELTDLIEAYEDVRYGERDPSDTLVEKLRSSGRGRIS